MANKWFAILLSLLSGLLLTAGLPNFNLFFISWGALIPLFIALRDKTAGEAFRLGYICGLAHFMSALYWIQFVVGHYGGLPFAASIGALFLLCAYLAIYPALFGFVAQRWGNRSLLWIFGLPGVWVMLEWIRAQALTGFPWANLGYTQTPFTPLVQVADIVGVYGVSWLIVLGNTTLMACIYRSRVRTSLVVFGLCFLGSIAYGSWRVKAIENMREQSPAWPVAVIQGNIDQNRKWDPAFQQETLRRYRELSLKAASRNPAPELLVWPETAAPFFYGIEDSLTAQLNGIFAEIGKPVLFGSPAVTKVDGRARLQNRAYLIDGGVLRGAYAKQHLVPFGEYVPYQKILFFVHRLVEAAGDFAPGGDSSPLFLKGKSLGVLICYEGIFPELSRYAVQHGANALINITNDAWYGRTSAPYQHMEISRWRAIEFRVPLIRAANTGVSTIVDATGQICGAVPLDEEGYLVCSVHPLNIQTFYARWGDLFALFCLSTSFVALVYTIRR
ncbi:MAG: apolipoprotein N-acyltransferase [Syntrophobacteraceae bacterium]